MKQRGWTLSIQDCGRTLVCNNQFMVGWCVVPACAIKAYGQMQVHIYSFLTLALDGGQQSASCPGHSKSPWYPRNRSQLVPGVGLDAAHRNTSFVPARYQTTMTGYGQQLCPTSMYYPCIYLQIQISHSTFSHDVQCAVIVYPFVSDFFIFYLLCIVVSIDTSAALGHDM
jgi:hypothetical protein